MIRINSYLTDTGVIGDGITSDNSLTTSTLQDGACNFMATTTTTSGFPDPSTTGVPDDTSLTSVNGDFTTSYAGQVIDALHVSGQIIINHPGVIVRNCEAQQVIVYADGATIQDSTILGQGGGGGGSGIVLLGGNATVERNDVSGVDNGIWLESNGNRIADNYIHDLRNDVPDPHMDGLQIPPGTTTANNVIAHNNFDLGDGVNACIMTQDASNITIDNNRLHGGTYTIYLDHATDCSVTNNVYAAYVYGTVAGEGSEFQYYSGNVDETTTTSTTTTETSPPLAVDTTPTSGDGAGGGTGGSTGGDTGGGFPGHDGSTTSSIEFTNVKQAANDQVVFRGTVTDNAGHSVPAPGSVVLGTSGDDQLSSTSGSDLFRGNGGHDTFEFEANFGRDVISDFHATNIVEFRDTSFNNFADVMAHASQHGQDVVIDDGAGNSLTLTNTVLSNLDRTDFHFA